MFRSTKFDVPTIVVGNLSMGGTGKSPHIEYLIRLLKEQFKVATLSRGYKRESKGYIEADENSTAAQVGDEPLQFKRKFNDITVAVEANRVLGITNILTNHGDTNVVLLDDAFQHRKVIPGYAIMLTDYNAPFYKDHVVPSGRLREFRSGYARANTIIVTKCPQSLTAEERTKITKKIAPLERQSLFFSYIKYKSLQPVYAGSELTFDELDAETHILLFTGIANATPLVEFLEQKQCKVTHRRFNDHHMYSVDDLQGVRKIFDNIVAEKKVLLTTEKDAMRITSIEREDKWNALPLYYMDIAVAFHGKDGAEFDEQIVNYVRIGND